MFKVFIIAIIALSFGIFHSSEGAAQSGACPANTCAKDGGNWAQSVKNCSATNCGKPQAAQSCKQRADTCARLSRPETQAACHEATRMAQCKASGQYVAPTGRVWEAGKR
jgi:membrane protease subunit (stomatin/prohibitin family)